MEEFRNIDYSKINGNFKKCAAIPHVNDKLQYVDLPGPINTVHISDKLIVVTTVDNRCFIIQYVKGKMVVSERAG